LNTERQKTLFWVSVMVLGVMLTVAASLVMEAIGVALGHHHWGSHGGAVGFPCLMVAAVIVMGVFRRVGLLEGEKVLETLRRLPDAGPVSLEDVVELRTPRSLWLTLAVTITVITLLIFMALLFLPAVAGTKPSGYRLVLFFGLFSLGPWYGYATRAGIVARVNREGIRGDNAMPKSSARWSDIASCEITLLPQPWGQVTRYTFRDAADKTLMRLMLGEGAEQQRFLAAIRECFG